MSPIIRSFIVISLVTLTTLAPAQAKPASQKPKAKTTAAKPAVDPNYTFIKQAYDYQSSGYPNRDVNIICSYMTDDFVIYNMQGGGMQRQSYMDYMYQMFKAYEYAHPLIKCTITIQNISLSPTTAVVTEVMQGTVTILANTPARDPITTTIQAGTYEIPGFERLMAGQNKRAFVLDRMDR